MSLADELLADLEEVGQEDDLEVDEDGRVDDLEDIEEVTEEDESMDDARHSYDRVTSVARLRDSERFTRLMRTLDADGVEDASHFTYEFVVDANNVSAEIDNEINVIHKFVRDKYGKRFPELESLVPVPLEYLACVNELGNDVLAKAQNKDILARILLPATVIVVSVTASTTQGQELDPDELNAVSEACEMAAQLQEAKLQIFQFVKARMSTIAPNLSTVVGAEIAAKLMGVAGGLSQLTKMPACNILVLGAQKRTLSGFSSTAVLPHTGFVYYSPMIQILPPDLRRKAARQLAAKCALAARCDVAKSSPDRALGERLLDEVRTKFDKLLEPPATKQTKPLPKPLDMASKKRGGRRMRAMKERLGMTEMRRRRNRMTFGDLEEDVLQDTMGFSMGQIKSAGADGRIRYGFDTCNS